MRNRKTVIPLVLALIAGLAMLAYPTVSDWWNTLHQSRLIAGYADTVARMDDESYGEYLARARAYNETLRRDDGRFQPTAREHARYESLLDVTGDGIMGYIEIPSLDVSLPIYHGTDDTVLQVAAGHVEGSSLPVGGPGTHCVISGHRGLPSARLFTDLDRLREGDTFTLHVLDETLTYEVDRIRIVDPSDVTDLRIEEGRDLCTLVTCTPYGINTQRLLVRGHRVTGDVSAGRVAADATLVDPMIVAVPLAVLPLTLLWAATAIATRMRVGGDGDTPGRTGRTVASEGRDESVPARAPRRNGKGRRHVSA